jgi:hypothetical protein
MHSCRATGHLNAVIDRIIPELWRAPSIYCNNVLKAAKCIRFVPAAERSGEDLGPSRGSQALLLVGAQPRNLHCASNLGRNLLESVSFVRTESSRAEPEGESRDSRSTRLRRWPSNRSCAGHDSTKGVATGRAESVESLEDVGMATRPADFWYREDPETTTHLQSEKGETRRADVARAFTLASRGAPSEILEPEPHRPHPLTSMCSTTKVRVLESPGVMTFFSLSPPDSAIYDCETDRSRNLIDAQRRAT